MIFNQKQFCLQTEEPQKSVSLAGLFDLTDKNEIQSFFDKIANELSLSENLIHEFVLGDLLNRMPKSIFLAFLSKIWFWAADEAQIESWFVHPRSDLFINSLIYNNPILPETFLQLDPENSTTQACHQLKVYLKIASTDFEIESVFQEAFENKEIQIDELQFLSKQNNNVIRSFTQKLVIQKSMWNVINQNQKIELTEDMEKQLRVQHQNAVARGDLQAAELIQKFLWNQKK